MNRTSSYASCRGGPDGSGLGTDLCRASRDSSSLCLSLPRRLTGALSDTISGEKLWDVINDQRRSMDREREQHNKRIEELQNQRDEYKKDRDAFRTERDEWKTRCEAAEAKLRTREQESAHSLAARTILDDGGLYHGSIRRVGGTEVPHGTGLLR
ncbi:unnamed protein product [Vitrella brassicaformis CCMP3155]|uniref:Uncharacterized protein n=1 Tax=Vitrella brassicaformis (strain CCMP3155) TaxID=1169540 RepID=A0A0G4G553_VITBC|nr:unnamed protein product [Vitrella brassicaformis CCMP3155]|eukprot:CEM23452.1 unnamed protein product [Vitrella brassicaformis CCMP3155]